MGSTAAHMIEMIEARLIDTLIRAKYALESMSGGGAIVHQGSGFGDAHDDTEIRADRELGRLISEDFRHLDGIGTILCEGMDPIVLCGSGLLVTVDPLDGSLDYKTGRGTFALPYTATVAIFDRVSEPRFRDCIVAGTVDLRTGDRLLAVRGKGCTLNGNPCRTNGATRVNLREGITIAEFYYPENRRLAVEMFDGERGYLRSVGSAAYEMALVVGGVADAFICDRQKNHELGAGYRLVVEAGGVAVDHDGNDLGDRPYDFTKQTPVILAASQELADEFVGRVRRVRSSM